MLLVKRALALFLFAPLASADLTWWTDGSCDDRIPRGVEKVMQETIDTVKMIRDRMIDSREYAPHPHRGYETVFHERAQQADDHPGDGKSFRWTQFKKMNGGWPDERYGIADFTKEPLTGDAGRKAAEVRVYCDNDARFKPKEDDPNGQRPLNSEKKDDDTTKEWVDERDVIDSLGLGCAISDDDGDTIMVTYVSRYSAEGQSRLRSSVTICDNYLKADYRVDSLQGLPEGKFLSKIAKQTIDALAVTGVATMLHEMHHIRRYDLLDVGYRWEEIMKMTPDESMSNPDSHGIFGALMWALERKYALDPADPKSGRLKKDKTIRDRVPYVLPPGKAQVKRGLRRRRPEVNEGK